MKNNKGFTLVEIMVVLVILAILAAATIPSMLGFVKDAKNKSMSAEVRAVYVAAQAYASEQSAADVGDSVIKGEIEGTIDENHKLYVLLGDDAEGEITAATVTAGKVESITYTTTGGQSITITNGQLTYN